MPRLDIEFVLMRRLPSLSSRLVPLSRSVKRGKLSEIKWLGN